MQLTNRFSCIFNGQEILWLMSYYVEEKFKEAQQRGEVKKDIDPDFFAFHISVLTEGLMFVSAVTGTESSLIANGEKIAQNLWTMIKTET